MVSGDVTAGKNGATRNDRRRCFSYRRVRTCGSRVAAQNPEVVAQSAFTQKGRTEGLWPAHRVAAIHSLFAGHGRRVSYRFLDSLLFRARASRLHAPMKHETKLVIVDEIKFGQF